MDLKTYNQVKRLTLDRNDALNSAVVNERFRCILYWAPSKIRERFAMLVKDGYKGSGITSICFGAFNGQTNRTEDRNLHVVTRVSYPF
jgi:hypothetical protein